MFESRIQSPYRNPHRSQQVDYPHSVAYLNLLVGIQDRERSLEAEDMGGTPSAELDIHRPPNG